MLNGSIFQPIKRIVIIAGLGLLPISYLAAYDALTIIMPPILYLAGLFLVLLLILAGSGGLYIGYEMIRTRITELGSQRIIAAAEAQMILAEVEQKRVMVITAPKDHQLVIKDNDFNSYYRQLHLSANSHVNGKAEPPSEDQFRMYQTYHGLPTAHQAETPFLIEAESESDMSVLDRYNGNWIRDIILPAPHVHYCGATRSGKTTLANYHLEAVIKQEPNTEMYLLNPKDTAARKPFIIDPQYRDIDQIIQGLSHFNQLMIKRKNNPTLSQSTNKIIFIIDEWDWIYQVYGSEASRLLIPLVKVGAELRIQVILIGQSPLSTDTGLTQSFYHNMVRVAIWQEGARLLNNYPLDRKYKAPLMAEYEDLKSTAPRYELQIGNKLRYCVVVPMAGNPSVQIIPFLTDPQRIAKNQEPVSLKPTPEEKEILITWWRMKNKPDFSGNRLHKAISGLESNANAKQLQKYRDLIQKFGETPGF